MHQRVFVWEKLLTAQGSILSRKTCIGDIGIGGASQNKGTLDHPKLSKSISYQNNGRLTPDTVIGEFAI